MPLDLKTFAGAAAIGWAVTAGCAQAATLAGDSFDISYYYPTRTTLYADAGTFKDPTSFIPVPRDPKGKGSLGPYSIIYNFGQTVHFTAADFDGVVFTDLTANRIRGVTLSFRGGVTGLDASDLSFTSGAISLNLSDVTAQAGSAIQISISSLATPAPRTAFVSTLSPVPLPASAPMFGAALLALAGFGYGMNRRVALKGERSGQA